MKKHHALDLNKLARTTNVFYELSPEESKNLKSCLYSMFVDIKRICDKHNLILMLSGGSALGAVRHKGFIPWDDDIDLMMPRDDYDKFIDLFEKELGEKYYLSTPRSKNRALSFFAQVVKKNTIMRNIGDSEGMSSGICVDIHPIEYASDNYMCRCFEAFRSILLRGIACCVRIYKSENKELFIEMTKKSRVDLVLYRIYYLVGFLFSFKSKYFWFYLFDKYTSSKKRTSYMTIPAGRAFYWGELLPTNVFLPPSSGVFEGMEVYLPNDVNSYLFNLYGNYMEIPPEEERERHFYLDFDLGPDYK